MEWIKCIKACTFCKNHFCRQWPPNPSTSSKHHASNGPYSPLYLCTSHKTHAFKMLPHTSLPLLKILPKHLLCCNIIFKLKHHKPFPISKTQLPCFSLLICSFCFQRPHNTSFNSLVIALHYLYPSKVTKFLPSSSSMF